MIGPSPITREPGAFCRTAYPALQNSVALLDCEVDERIERFSHAIVIGRVRRVLEGGASGAFVTWRGAYDQVGWGRDEIARAIGLSPAGPKL